jgi:hypothetical protein
MKNYSAIFEMAKELIANRPDLYHGPGPNGSDNETAENLDELAKDYTETEGGDLETNLHEVHSAYRAVWE